MITKRRVQKLESGLTPKQAIMRWLQEAHGFGSIESYFNHLRTQPDNALPMTSLPMQVAAGVEEDLKEKPQEEIDRAIGQAMLDVLFLFHLHEQVNHAVGADQRHKWSRFLVLITGLKGMMRHRYLGKKLQWSRVQVELEMPYPLDPETAPAVDAARQNYVFTWEDLEEGDELVHWLLDSFLAEGKTTLPDDASELRKAGERYSQETRELFPDQEAFEYICFG